MIFLPSNMIVASCFAEVFKKYKLLIEQYCNENMLSMKRQETYIKREKIRQNKAKAHMSLVRYNKRQICISFSLKKYIFTWNMFISIARP